LNGKSVVQWNAEEQALLVKDEEARLGISAIGGRNSTNGAH